MNEGTRLWDLRSGRELAAPARGDHPCLLRRRGGRRRRAPARTAARARSFLSCGRHGLLRLADRGRRPGGAASCVSSRRGACPPSVGPVLAGPRMAARWGRRRSRGGPTRSGPGNGNGAAGARRSSTPGRSGPSAGDGRWAASSGWHSDRVWLWNVGTGQRVREWVVGKRAMVSFTPDSRAPDHRPGRGLQLLGRGDPATDPSVPPGGRPLPGSRWRSRRIAGSWPWRWRRASST